MSVFLVCRACGIGRHDDCSGSCDCAALLRHAMPRPTSERRAEEGECDSCGQGETAGRCPSSRRACGHHCNHSWSHDECCWCGETFTDEAVADPAPER